MEGIHKVYAHLPSVQRATGGQVKPARRTCDGGTNRLPRSYTFYFQTRAAMEKHEDNCWHRVIPCVWCDVEIGMKRLKEHHENLAKNAFFMGYAKFRQVAA